MARKKPVDAPPSPSATAQTYEESLVPRLNEQGWTLANGVQKVQIDNQDFFRSDYDRASAHLTVVCIVLKDYIFEFTLSADSLEEIESLRRSLSTISFGPVTVH